MRDYNPSPGSNFASAFALRATADKSLILATLSHKGRGEERARMHRRTFLGLTATLAAARIMPVRAQSLAGRQIKIVVPFPAGGPTDIVARPFAQMLGEALKATIVVDNRGGAG